MPQRSQDSYCQFGRTNPGTRSPIELLWTAKKDKYKDNDTDNDKDNPRDL